MKTASLTCLSLLLLGSAPVSATECKAVHASLDEVRSTTGCNPGLSACFLGVVDGNHGLRGTTHFASDSFVPTSPSTSPGFIIYSGPFEYRTGSGTLTMRETGVSNGTTGLPSSGAVTAYQQIVDGTGEFEGATGHFFVSGRRVSGIVVTQLTGEICLP
ncbi:hypothetical protein ACFPOA_15310 [Lysobacter niabensis]|uniref:hypothetical protein n=1 Tax=Agrilutibacter niabensis TaxID=380628 RepID=UPI003616D51F